jgi:beta-lactamase regulating signal transducer with metallopeptidase domain
MTAAQWLEVLASYSLQVLIVIGACKMIQRVIVRTSDRCSVWNTCFFSIIALGCAALLLPRLHLIQPWSRLQPRTLLAASSTQDVVGSLLLAIWCIGATVSLVRWISRAYLLRRTLRHCERLSVQDVQSLLGDSNAGDSQRPLPAVWISDAAEGPFCWQLHQPTAVLPRFLFEGSRDDLRHVLVHELEHLNTNHPFQLFLQHLAQCVCWFHPAVWSAGRSASLTREFTCDEAAAAQGANSAAYLRTLLRIAERNERQRNASAIGFGKTPSEIVLRARRLVDLANGTSQGFRRVRLGKRVATGVLVTVTCLAWFVSIPCDPLASSRSCWSPWPTWTAASLHCFGLALRDYEQFDRCSQVHEILEANRRVNGPSQKSPAPAAARH